MAELPPGRTVCPAGHSHLPGHLLGDPVQSPAWPCRRGDAAPGRVTSHRIFWSTDLSPPGSWWQRSGSGLGTVARDKCRALPAGQATSMMSPPRPTIHPDGESVLKSHSGSEPRTNGGGTPAVAAEALATAAGPSREHTAAAAPSPP